MGLALSNMRLVSPAFAAGDVIPTKHTGEGEDVSPALAWSGVPDAARAFAVICHDPDAPLITLGSYGYVHWVLYNIPASAGGLEAATGAHTQGRNDFGNLGYGGPMPPEGHGVHRYYFWLLALDADLALPAGLCMRELLEKAEPRTIAMNRLVGTYQRG